jgi:heat shock protein HslJ
MTLAASSPAGTGMQSRDPVLTGPIWQLTRLGPLNRERSGITARFTADGKVSGFAGCNSYAGAYTASGTAIKVSRRLVATRKACEPRVMRREAAYLAALVAARSYSIDHRTLTLREARGRALLTFAVQPQSLAGTRWEVTGFNNGKQAVVSVMLGTSLTAVFSPDGRVSGLAGCNRYSGPVKVDPPKIAIGPLASTKKSCSSPAGVMEQESEYLASLGSVATYEIRGASLELRSADGALAVTMQRA